MEKQNVYISFTYTQMYKRGYGKMARGDDDDDDDDDDGNGNGHTECLILQSLKLRMFKGLKLLT